MTGAIPIVFIADSPTFNGSPPRSAIRYSFFTLRLSDRNAHMHEYAFGSMNFGNGLVLTSVYSYFPLNLIIIH